jgi:site-specific DNA-cytosine methylase
MTLPSLDLFTGIGGFTLALSGWATPVAYCDNNAGVVATLNRLMKKKRLPTAPVLRDVRDVEGIASAVAKSDAGRVDVVTAGFPCVGFSTAGSKEGLANDESALFYDAVVYVSMPPRCKAPKCAEVAYGASQFGLSQN